MRSLFRHAFGGSIDRSSPIRFRFDGHEYAAYQGDTLASALLANGVRLAGRSFKYHRPRGILGIGVEEPSAMVQLRSGGRWEPNIRATEVEVYDGLEATSQNRWPSLRFDVGAVNSVMAPFLPSGFYYKTFMWPKTSWMFYEKIIRKAAGLGKPPTQDDPDTYSRLYAFCDVLVVGAGPAGLAAALSAAASGAKVMLLDETAALGGRLQFDERIINSRAAEQWVSESSSKLESMPNVKVFKRTTAFGIYDQNLVAALERLADHEAQPEVWQDRQRVHWIRARQIVLACGSIERTVPFDGNDKPGVMLSSAVRGYARKYAVRCGTKAVVFTNNDSAYMTVAALKRVGVEVAAVVDSRAAAAGPGALEQLGDTEVHRGCVVTRAVGLNAVRAVDVVRLDEADKPEASRQRLACDLVCVSGGWTPTAHLFSHAQGRLEFSDAVGAYVPGEPLASIQVAGSANGEYRLAECLRQGAMCGHEGAARAGFPSADLPAVPSAIDHDETDWMPLWRVPVCRGKRTKAFVDIQNDVTLEDIALAHLEGYVSVEHLKRYTTLGMGTDQGRISNINGLTNLARLRDLEIPQVGHTTFRPPYTAVGLGAIAGSEIGTHAVPVRRTALHRWHMDHHAHMENTGVWKRPAYYPRPGEQAIDAINREALHVRAKVGITDVSTLGKIDIQGRDAAEFLERIYVNRWHSLPVGRVRYGLMLREDGFVFDDGTTTRTGDEMFYMTTTTGKAGPVMEHLEFYAQTVWPQLKVHLTSITDQWAGMALAGPHSRDVLSVLIGERQASDEHLPYMGFLTANVAGIEVNVFRVTFSGELGYEIHMPWTAAVDVWESVLEAGEKWDIAPYGLEAMSVLRIEKGHVVATELDGRTTAADLGFARMMKSDKDFIGRQMAAREALCADSRLQLVGLRSQSGRPIPKGAQIVEQSTIAAAKDSQGHVTSTCYSPNLDQEIGLALLAGGRQLEGKVLFAASPVNGRIVPVEVVPHVFFDPTGARCRV